MQKHRSYWMFKLGLLTLVFLSCAVKEDLTPMIPDEVKDINMEDASQDSSAIAYLALGDSYTIGSSVEEEERYPRQLVDMLIQKGIKISPLKIVAKIGWTTGDLAKALDAEAINNHDYNLVSLLIGVNNQYRGYNFDQYKQQFTALLDRAIAYAGGNKDRVFVVSIPDYGVTPFGQLGNPQKIAEDIDRYNAANMSITESRGVKYFDITPISREALDDRTLIASDGLHPSGKMYARWAELMLPEVLQMLSQ